MGPLAAGGPAVPLLEHRRTAGAGPAEVTCVEDRRCSDANAAVRRAVIVARLSESFPE